MLSTPLTEITVRPVKWETSHADKWFDRVTGLASYVGNPKEIQSYLKGKLSVEIEDEPNTDI